MAKIRILIIEDEPLIAEDIRDFLSNMNYTVEGIVHTKADAIEALNEVKPDLAIIDINLEGNYEGLDIAQWINEENPIPFLYLTSYATKSIVTQAKKTRPMGYILKPFTEEDLFSSIEIALHNFSRLHKPKKISRSYINKKLPDHLTESEFKILTGIYEGQTNKQMAQNLFVSINTIKTHVKRVYEKLDTNTRTSTISKIRQLIT